MPQAALPVPVDLKADRLHVVGDSLVFNGEADPIRAYAHRLQRNARGLTTVTARKGERSTSLGLGVVTSDGIPGTSITSIVSNFATRVAAYSPTILYVVVSPNDLSMPGATWQSNMDSIRTSMLAQNPTCKIVVRSMVLGGVVSTQGGEAWVDNGDGTASWPAVANNPALDTLNAAASSWCTNNGAYWINVRGTNGNEPSVTLGDGRTAYGSILAAEKALNPGKATSGILSLDGEHPSIPPNSGQLQIGLMICSSLSFSV